MPICTYKNREYAKKFMNIETPNSENAEIASILEPARLKTGNQAEVHHWTIQEHKRFIDGVKLYGKNWD